MTAGRFKYQGLQLTPTGVWVHFSARVGTTIRHAEILVPWEDLTSDEFLNQLDREVRRRIISVWSGLDVETPLF